MHVNPYLSFNGTCADAFKLYTEVLRGDLLALMTYKDTPMANEVPPEQAGRIVHACLKIGETLLMGGDCPPDRYQEPHGVCVNIGLHEVAEAERIFAALSEGGSVEMPLAETFWADRFGMLTDKFGTPWMINCECKKS